MELFHDFANYCDGRLLVHVSGANFQGLNLFTAGSFGK